MAEIPRRIFQTGPRDLSRRSPAEVRLVEALRHFCGEHGFEYEYFDDDAMDAFVQEEFPEHASVYRSLGSIIERADLWRYLVVHRRGGFYLDLDCEVLPAFSRVLDRLDRPIVQIERDAWFAFSRGLCQLPEFGQFFFGFPQGSELLGAVVDEVVRRVTERPFGHLTELQQVLHHTGPGPFGAVLTPRRGELRVFRPDTLVRHHCAGSWLGGRAWGRRRLLVRRCRLDYESVG